MRKKASLNQSIFRICLALLIPMATAPVPVMGSTYYWDSDGVAVGDNPVLGTGLGGAGTWDTSSLLWYNSQTNTDAAWSNLTTDTAIFVGTAGAVTVTGGGVNVGALQFLTTGYTLGGGQITLGSAGANLFVGSSVATTISSVIAGSNGLGVYGPGTLNLSGLNSYTGNTSISNGATLNLDFTANATNIINSASPLVFNGGTLKLSGVSGATDSQTFASTSVAGNSIITLTQNAAASLTVDLGAITQTAGGSLNFSVIPLTTGVIAKTSNTNVNGILGPWASVGTGTTVSYATVNGSNQIVAYTGGTAAATGANLTDTTGVVNYNLAAAAGTVPATFSANTIRYTGAAATTAPGATGFTVNGLMNTGSGLWTIGTNNITIGANKDLQIITGTNGITITSVIQNNVGGASNLTYSGTGALTLSKANTYTGTTTVNSGTLNLGIAAALNSASSLVINGGTFGEVTFADTVASVVLRNGSITGTTGVLTSTAAFDLQSGTVSAPLGGTAGLNKTTPGTVTFSPTTAGTLTGSINIKAGTLIMGGTAVVSFAAADTINLGDSTGSADARLAVSNTQATYANPIVLSSGTTGNLSIGNQGTTAISFTNATTVSGTNNLIISNTSTGGLTLANVANTGTVTNGGSGGGVTTISALGAGVTALNQIGTSPLTLTPAWSTSQLGSTITNNGGGLLTLTGGVSGGVNLVFNANGTGGITVASTSNTGTITNSGTGTGTTTLTTISAGVTALNLTGTSALTLTPAWTAAQFGSTVTNNGAGLLTLTGGITGASNLVFNATSTGGVTVTAAMTTTGTITNSGAGTGNVTLSAAIPATVTDIVQNGGGTLTLTSGANAYTGTTTITNGTLSFASTPATGATSGLGNSSTNIVLGGAATKGTLVYTGTSATLTRNFTINAGGGEIDSTGGTLTINPGGVLTASTLTIAPGGPLTFGGASTVTLGGATANVPLISGTNTLTKVGTGTLNLSTLGGIAAIQSAMPINIQAGTLTVTTTAVATPSPLGTGALSISPTATLSFTNGGATFTLPNNITITNAAGTAILTASGTVNATGTITFAAGASTPTLQLKNTSTSAFTTNASGAISGTGNIELNGTAGGSTVNLSGPQNQTGTITNVGASGAPVATLSGAIGSGITAISQAGGNAFTVSSAVPLSATLNTFTSTGTGLWTFSGGITGTQPLTFNANSSGGITVATGAVNNTGTITNSGTGGGVTTISANIGANVTNVLQSSATTQLVLSGTNTYTGNSTVTAGLLSFATTLAIPGYSTSPATAFGTFASPRVSASAGTTLALPFGAATNAITNTDIANFLNGTYGTFAAGSSLGIDTTNASPTTANLTAVITDTSAGQLGFTKTGTNTLTVNSANTYTGPTLIANGTLSVPAINNVGAVSGPLGAPTTITNATISLGFGATTGVLSYTGAGETTDRVINLSGVTGGGTIDNSGTGTLTFSSSPTYTGAGPKTLTFSGAGNTSFTAPITGNFSTGSNPLTITKTGAGTLTLSGANTATTLIVAGGTINTGATGLSLSNTSAATVQTTGAAAGSTVFITGKLIFTGVGSSANGADVGSTVAGVTLDMSGAVLAGTVANANVDFFSNGTTILGNANTYQGQTQINGTTLVVTSLGTANGAAPSSLGQPASGNSVTGNLYSTILATSGVLKYVGTGETTDRALDLRGTTSATTLDQSGTGLLKFTGTNTAGGAGIKTMTLQGSTTGTGEIAGPIVNNSTTNTTGITKAGTGTWTLSGVNTYTGATTVNGGNLVLSMGSTATGKVANTAITVNSGGTLSVLSPTGATTGYLAGNTATVGAGAKLTLNAGGAVNLSDGIINNFVIGGETTFAGNAVTLAGGSLSFDIGSTLGSNDQIDVRLNNVAGSGQATSSGSNAISITPSTGTTSLTAGAYTLINATAAGSTLSNANFYLASPNLLVGGTLYNLSLSGTSGTEVLTVSISGGAAAPNTAYWQGTQLDGKWNTLVGGLTTNWAAAATGTPDTYALPASTTNVIFAANSATNLSTTLEQNFTINSLTFSGAGTANAAGAAIAAGAGAYSLTINAAAMNGNAAGNGITVSATAGADLISADVILGASQTWTNNSTANPISFTGLISGSGLTLTTAGAGFIQIGNGGTAGSIATNVALVTNGILAFNRSNTITQGTDFASTISGTGGVTQNGLGTLDLGGANTYTGNTTVARGTLNISGTGSLTGLPASSKLNINPTAGNNAVVNYTSSATSTLFAITGATVAGTASAYYQSSGLVVMTPNTTTSTQSVVGGNGAYGFYNISGGTLRNTTGTAGGSRFTVSNQGTASATNGTGVGVQTGVVYVNGTGFIDQTNGEWWLNYGLGEVTVADSGKIDRTGSNNAYGIIMNTATGVTGGGYGVLNVAGAGAQVIMGAQPIKFGNATTAGQGDGESAYVNVAAGTLSLGTIATVSLPAAPVATNYGYYNYAGGTVKASAALATGWVPASAATITFIHTIYGAINNNDGSLTGSGAPSFNGGLTVDTNTFGVTIPAAMPLLGASGVRVTQTDLTVSGGSGYIGAPAVIFSKPASASGVPAAGYALMSGGSVVGIVITNPGVYAAGETPIITLIGGGATTAATVTSGPLATANSGFVGGLTKINTGTLTISGAANTFTGPVDIKGGMLTVTTLANGGVAGTLGASSNAASNLLLDGGILGYTGTVAGTTDRNFTFAANNSGLDASGTTAGTLTLTAANAMTVASGLGAANFILQGTGTAATGSGFLGTLIADGTGTPISVIKNGTGTWNVTNNANSYTGATTINAGILSVAKLANGGSNSGIGSSSNAAANLVLSGGTLQYTGGGDTTDRNFTFGNATTAAGGGFDTTGATGPLVITGNMTAVNTAASTQVLTLTSLAASGSNALNGNIVDSSGTALTGVTKSGAGAWTLGGANAYTGTTTVNAGTLNITGTNSNASPITFTSGGNGIVNISSSGTVAAGAITWSGATGGVLNLNSGTLLVNGGGLTSSSATVNALSFNGGTLKSSAPFAISATLNINVQAGGGTIDTTGGNITSSSAIGNTASPGTLNIIGGNTLQTAVNTTMTGPVNISGTGTTLRLTSAQSPTGVWTVGTGAILDINNLSESVGGLAGGGTVVNTGANAVRTLTITGTGGNNFSGSIQQPTPSTTSATGVTLNLSSASATQTFSGANTYGGPTTITTGKLAVNGGSLGNTAITVAAGGTFAPLGTTYTAGTTGPGTLGASLTLNAGGTLSMLDGQIGIFNLVQNDSFATAGLTLTNGILNLELSSAGIDQIVVSGGAVSSSITGTNTINITGLGTSLTSGTYTLVTASGITAGNTLFRFSNGTATDSIVVGPSTYTLTLSGAAGMEQLIVGAAITNMTWTGQTNGTGAANSVWTATPASNNNFATSTPTATDYIEGAAITFQDQNVITATNVTNSTVIIDAAGVNPGAVTVDNTAVNYTFQNASGSVGIAGSTGLSKSGTGTLTLLGQNSYTGGTELNGGIVNVGVAEGAGFGPLGNGGVISFSGGTLQYSAANNFDYSSRFSTAVGNLISIDTNGQNVTFATALTSPSGTLTKSGVGTLTLGSNVNTYSGATIVNGGTLLLTGSNGASGVIQSPTITVNSGGTLETTATDSLGFTAGRNALTINGGTVLNNTAGTRVTLSNTVTMTGGFLAGSSLGDSNSGAFSLNNATSVIATSDTAGNPATISANVSTQAVAVFQVNRGAFVAAGAPDLVISGKISPYGASGANGITIKGNGITTLSGANTYTGTTTLASGTLIIGANNTIKNTNQLTFGTAGSASVGALQLNAFSQTLGTTLVTSNGTTPNTISIASGQTFTTGTLTIGYDAAGGSGAINSNLTVSGAGTFAISGATTVNIGVNQAATNASYYSQATLDLTGIANFTAAVTTFNIGVGTTTTGNGTLLLSNTANTITATTLQVGHSGGNNGNGTSLLQFGTGTNVINANTINLGFSKVGANVSFLSHTAGSPGTLTIAGTAGGASTANITIASNNGTSTAAQNVVFFDVTGHVVTIQAGTLQLGNSNNTGSGGANGTLSFDAGTISALNTSIGLKSGTAGTGTGAGTLNIGGGTFTVGTGGSFVLATNTAATGTATGTVNVTGSGTLNSNADITRGGGTNTTANLNLNGASALIDMSGGGAVAHNIGSATNAINNFTFTDGTLQNIGTVYGGITLAGTGSRLFNETGTFSGQVNGTITGTGVGLNKAGTGTLTLLGANTFSGNIDIVGTLIANRANNTVNPTSSALGNPQAARNINVNSGGTLLFSSSDTLGGSTTSVVATLVVNAGGTVTNDASGWFNTLGPVQLNGGTLTGVKGAANAQAQMYSLQGTVTVGGSTASTISGPAAGGSTFGGYHLAANTAFNVADATGSSASDLNVSATFIDRPNSQGAGGLTKSGAGTMTLSGANSYTGVTAIQNGTLQVGVGGVGSTASGSSVAVNGANAALAGTGTVGGATSVTSGVIRPGDLSGASVGTLIFGSTLAVGNSGKIELGLSSSTSSDSSFDWAVNDALTYLSIPGNYTSAWSTIGNGNDALRVAGALTLGASTVIDASTIAGTYDTGDIFKLLDWSGVGTANSLNNGSTSFFNLSNLALPTLGSGQTWDTSAFTTYGVVVVVPEPSRLMLAFAALAVLGLRRRRSIR